MIQAKFSLHQSHLTFLEQARSYGFKDKSQAVRVALDRLIEEITRQRLRESAVLYAEELEKDPEVIAWLDDVAEGWPE
ncbi:MAG: hypothetical protein KFH87_04080 [Bacteroidetes bacterium]|nr:hypothetical protein [Bacteroidota bacterium]